MLAKQHMWSFFGWKCPVNEDRAKKSKLVAIKMCVPFDSGISSPRGLRWPKQCNVFYTPRLENWLFALHITTFFLFPFVITRAFMPLVIFLQLFSSQLLRRFLWGWSLRTSKTPTDISTSIFRSHVLRFTVWHIASSYFPSAPQQHQWQSNM